MRPWLTAHGRKMVKRYGFGSLPYLVALAAVAALLAGCATTTTLGCWWQDGALHCTVVPPPGEHG